jgi:hypothetical protein
MASKKKEASEKTSKKKKKRQRLLQMAHQLPMPISEVKKKLRHLQERETSEAPTLIFDIKKLFVLILLSSILIFVLALFFAQQ